MLELLFAKYGAALRTGDLAEVLRYPGGAKVVSNLISAEAFPIPTYKVGNRRLADVRDVAAYLDAQRVEATARHRAEQAANAV